jgi:hypothetical protein
MRIKRPPARISIVRSRCQGNVAKRRDGHRPARRSADHADPSTPSMD